MDREKIIQEISEAIGRLQRLKNTEAWQDTGLSRAQAGVLFVVFHHKGVTAKEVASFLGVSGSSITQIIEPLAQGNFVVREADKNDRRLVHISLTAKGRGAVKRLINSKTSAIRSALAKFDDKDLVKLAKLHRQLDAYVQNAQK